MTGRRTPLRVAVLPYLLGDDEPLVGDLVEEWPRRSNAWFWRQVVFAMFVKAMTAASATLREPQRLSGALGSAAILLILSFQVVVAGSLLDDLIQRVDPAQVPRIDHPEWLVFVVLLSLPAACLIGRAMSCLHRRSRVATVLVCGASAAAVGWVTVSLLSATGSFFPSAARQTAAGMVFVLGLLIGSSSCSPLDRQARSAHR
jgi:hypothetical protein